MKKAEKIFKDTKRACKQHIKDWGYEENVGFNRMTTEELVYTRTVNEIKKFIEREYKDIIIDFKLEIITEAEAKQELQVMKMVEATLKNQYICS